MERTGILIEITNGTIKNACFGMITAARTDNRELYAFIINSNAEEFAEELKNYGICKILNIECPNVIYNDVFRGGVLQDDNCINGENIEKELKRPDPIELYTILIKAMSIFDIHTFIGLSTGMGKEILPRMAAELDAPLVMDCIGIDFENNIAKAFRYSGKTIARIKIKGKYCLLGIKPNIIDAVPIIRNRSGIKKHDSEIADIPEIISFPKDDIHTCNSVNCHSIRLIKTKIPEPSDDDNFSTVSLTDADIIISGGRGMKNRKNFKILAECAAELGAAVGASRVAVDSNWVPYSIQVGQTGEKVSPKVYIACGISGSIQHFAGMKTSDMIIAVNIDPNAPIIGLCDYYIIDDLFEIIPRLTEILKNMETY